MTEENDESKPTGKDHKISELPHVRSADYVSLYANYAQCSISPWDVRIVFAEVGEPEPDKPSVIERATIILPPQVANALIEVLQKNVELYKEQMRAVMAEAEAQKKAAEESEQAQPKGEPQETSQD